MSQRGYFFDSVGGDRPYSASYWASLLSFLRDEGVIGGWQDELEVTENSPQAMSVRVGIGAALVQGRAVEVYGAAEAVTLSAANPTNPRIDRIVARLDYVGRTLTLLAKAGTPAATPAAPALTRDANTYELSLAQVAVAAGATIITDAAITDERSDDAVCGYSTATDALVHINKTPIDHPDGSITSAALGSASVTSAKLAGGAVGTLALADGAVTAAKIADGTVGTAELAAGAVDASKLAAGAVGAAAIADGTVGSAELAAGAVTSTKLAAGAVTGAALGAGAVGTTNIANAAVTADKLAPDSVGSSEIFAGSVGTAELADGGVTSAKIAAANVTGTHLATDAVTAAKIAAGAVGTSELTSPIVVDGITNARRDLASPAGTTAVTASDDVITCLTGATDRTFTLPAAISGKRYTFIKRDNGAGAMRINAAGADVFLNHLGASSGQLVISGEGDSAEIVGGASVWFVLNAEIPPGGVTSDLIAAGAVGTAELANGSVNNAKLAPDAVQASNIAAGAVGTSEIAAGAVGAAEIADGSVGTAELAAGAVTLAKLAADSVDATKIAAAAVGTSEIAGGAVTLAKLAADSVDGTKIVAGSIGSTELATGAVISGKLATNAVTSGAIAADAVTNGKIAGGAVTGAKVSSPLDLSGGGGLIGNRRDFASVGGTVLPTDDSITCLTGATTRTFTLPAVIDGKVIMVVKRDSGAGDVRVNAAGGDTLLDPDLGTVTGISLTKAGASAILLGGTSQWFVVSRRT